MPWNIKKSTGGYKVCKKIGNKKCLPGKSKSRKQAQKRIAAIYVNEKFDQVVERFLRNFQLDS